MSGHKRLKEFRPKLFIIFILQQRAQSFLFIPYFPLFGNIKAVSNGQRKIHFHKRPEFAIPHQHQVHATLKWLAYGLANSWQSGSKWIKTQFVNSNKMLMFHLICVLSSPTIFPHLYLYLSAIFKLCILIYHALPLWIFLLDHGAR